MIKSFMSILVVGAVLFTAGCGSDQKVYNPSAKFGGSGSGIDPNGGTGPVVGEATTADTGIVDVTGAANPIPGEHSLGTPVDHPFKTSMVYFAFDSAVVSQDYNALLQQVADYINANPTYNLNIAGHCDERGSEEYNRALGEKRALSVKQALIALGAPEGRLYTVSYGEEKPAAQGQTPEAYAQNRRCEFEVYSK